MIARCRWDRRFRRPGALFLLVAGIGWVSVTLLAQTQSAASDALRREIDQRFEVLPLSNGVALRPKTAVPGVRLVELTDGTIAVDGSPVTGQELRTRLGAGADAVLRLSYLGPAERQALVSRPSVPEPPAVPEPPPPRPESERPNRTAIPPRVTRGNSVRIGGSVTVEAGQLVNGDAVAVGGSAHVFGEVRGDVVAIGGSVDLGPQAVVSGDVVVVGGEVHRDPGARVGGEVQEIGLRSARFSELWRR